MPNFDFSQPQRQSRLGLVLIFATSLVQLARNLWVVLLYFFVQDFNTATVLTVIAGLVVILLATLGYSILYFLKFQFHIDKGRQEFILQKGVFSSDLITIPFDKIQQVNFKRNILQRILGIYSIMIETAGSEEKEVEIKALSKEKADVLADRLMILSKNAEQTEEDSANVGEEQTESKKPEWQHKVNLFSLIKLGLTSNWLRGLTVLVAFYFTLREQFMLEETLPAEISQPTTLPVNLTLLLIIFFLVVGMLITVAKTVIDYYDLHIQKFTDSLQVEMGLKNNTKVNLKAHRVQVMEVLVNPIQRRLDLFKLKISLASSENDLAKSQIKIPALPAEIVEQVKTFLYNSEIPERTLFRPSYLLLLRRISRGLMLLTIVLGVAYFYSEFLSWNWIVMAAGFLLAVLVIYNYWYFKNLKLYVSDDFLIRHSGVWVRNTQYLEMFRLQSVSVSQPIWYKRRGLVNLTFHSAGGDIAFPLVKKAEIQPLLNYLLYKVESTTRSWM